MKVSIILKIEEEIKKCRICLIEKPKDLFRLNPSNSNPHKRRSECSECRNKLVRERNFKNNTYRTKYRSMTEEERKAYIKNKSEGNQIRMKTNPAALLKKKIYDKTDKGIYNRYKGDCKRRGRLVRNINMLLSFEEFQRLILSPCYLCNVENCRGVDRLDSNLSHTLENSKPCCPTCNAMKNSKTKEEFLKHIEKILLNSKK